MVAPREHGLLFKGPMVRALLREIAAPGTGKSQTRRLLTKHNASFGSAPPLFWEHANFDRAWVDGKGSGSEYLHVPCHRGDAACLDHLDKIFYPDCSPCEECDRVGWPMTSHRLYPKWAPGERIWVRETFWGKHDTDSDGYRTIDCGPDLSLGQQHHPGIQYCATPENPDRPNEAGCWWPLPPEGWDGKQPENYDSWPKSWGEWEYYTKHPSIHMPRWACRITGEILGVRIQKLQDISREDAIAEGLSCLSKDGGQTWKYGIPDRDGLPGTDDDGFPWSDWSTDPRKAFRHLWDSINPAHPWESNPWLCALSFRPEVANG